MREIDLTLPDGRMLHVYDTGPSGHEDELVVCWHHGTPNIGAPPEPLFEASAELGIRWISFDRPGYGGSTPLPGRDVASAAECAAAAADHLGVDRFAVMGHSGGSPHALACGALLPERVPGVVCVAALAPFDAAGLDYFGGMIASGVEALTAASEGRAAREAFDSSSVYDPEFTDRDVAAFEGEWGWFGSVVGPAIESGPAPAIDDDLAYVALWGFSPEQVRAPVLFLHGGRDGIAPAAHGEWLAATCPDAELWLKPDDGHISVLTSGAAALVWLVDHARRPSNPKVDSGIAAGHAKRPNRLLD